MRKNILLAIVIVAMFFVGVARPAFALTTDQLQTQIKELLAKVAELTRQLNIQQGQGIDVSDAARMIALPPPTYKHRICLAQMRTLSEGQRGDEVRALQEFLQSEKLFTATPTGFFGPITREALKKWQTQEGIDPAGIAGHRTAERLRIWCGGSGIPGQRFSANPMRGNAPLTVVFDTWLSGERLPNVSYIIDFDDGSSEPATTCFSPADACERPGQNKHAYTQNGTYTATLNKITDICGGNQMCMAPVQTEVVGKLQISVGSVVCTKEYMPICGAQPIVCITTPCNPIPTTYSNRCVMNADGARFLYEGQCRTSANRPPTISEFSGPTTLAVNALGTWAIKATGPENGPLSYFVEWGETDLMRDSATIAPSGSFVQTTSLTHSYATAGTYTVTVIVSGSVGQAAKATTTVKVGDADVPIACTLQYDPVCGRPSGCANICPSGEVCPATYSGNYCQLHTPKTYGNRCQLNAADAQFLHTGKCTSTSGSTY